MFQPEQTYMVSCGGNGRTDRLSHMSIIGRVLLPHLPYTWFTNRISHCIILVICMLIVPSVWHIFSSFIYLNRITFHRPSKIEDLLTLVLIALFSVSENRVFFFCSIQFRESYYYLSLFNLRWLCMKTARSTMWF